MNMAINPEYARRIEELAASSGRAAEDVLNEIVGRGLDQVRVSMYGDAASIENAKRIVARIRALPECDPDDGFSGRDHDKILYPPEP